MKIAITSPIFIKNEEHKKYVDMTTKSIVSANHDIVWIPVENQISSQFVPYAYQFDHAPEDIAVLKGRIPQSVARAWNDGIAKSREMGCDYVLVINTDIVFKSNSIDRLVDFAEQHPEAVMWTMAETPDLAMLEECHEDENFSEHPHFSCFMVKATFFDEVGEFDENFQPAYCEDGDMHARLSLAGKKAFIYGGARFFHFGSRTIKSDQEEWANNSRTFPRNQEYFLKKWGHPVVNEPDRMREVYFKTPYNEPARSLRYWWGQTEVQK